MMKNTVILSLITLVLFPISLFAWSGSGTADDPIRISSETDLRTLSTNVQSGTTYEGMYIVLDNDIQMSSTNFNPIGTDYTKSFRGNFDGQCHTISNLQVSGFKWAGLFGLVCGETAVIKNVIVTQSSISSNASGGAAGGIVGKLGEVYSSSNQTNGSWTMANATCTGCMVTNSTISAISYAGGVVGWAFVVSDHDEYKAQVSGCYSANNSITATNNRNGYAGGVVGNESNGSSSNNATTSNAIDGNTVAGQKGSGEVGGGNVSNTDDNFDLSTEEGRKKALESGAFAIDANGNITTAAAKEAEDKKLEEEMQEISAGGFKLYVNTWNFVGSVGSTFNVFNNNNGSVLESNGEAASADIAALDYNYTANTWSEDYLFAKDNMTRGRGYFVYVFDKTVPSDWTQENPQGEQLTNSNGYVTLSSTINYSDDNLSITDLALDCQGSAYQNGYWYALSNPFDTYLTKAEILEGITNESGTVVYTYNATSGSYGSWEEAKAVMPGQGFMVSRNSAGTLEGVISKPSHSAKKKESTDIKDFSRIAFTAQSNNSTKNVYARYQYNNEVSNGFDNFDSYVMLSSYSDIAEPYFVVEQRNLYINEFESLPYECPINFHASKESETEFYISNNPEDIEISIVDLVDNSQTVISDGTKFTFTAYEGENEGRFLIKFAPSKNVSLTEVTDSEINVNIYNNNKEIFINGENLTHIQVINSLGQTVYNKNISGNSYSCNLNTPSGAYIVKIQTLNGTKTQKIIVK